MKTRRVQAKLAPNCTINPVLTILDLTKMKITSLIQMRRDIRNKSALRVKE